MKRVKSTRTWLIVLIILTVIGVLLRAFNYVSAFVSNKHVDYSSIAGLNDKDVMLMTKIEALSKGTDMNILSLVLLGLGIIALILIIKNFVSLGKMQVPGLIGIVVYIAYQVLDTFSSVYYLHVIKDLQMQVSLYANSSAAYTGTLVSTFVPHIIMLLLSIVTLLKLSKLDQSELDAQEINDL